MLMTLALPFIALKKSMLEAYKVKELKPKIVERQKIEVKEVSEILDQDERETNKLDCAA